MHRLIIEDFEEQYNFEGEFDFDYIPDELGNIRRATWDLIGTRCNCNFLLATEFTYDYCRKPKCDDIIDMEFDLIAIAQLKSNLKWGEENDVSLEETIKLTLR